LERLVGGYSYAHYENLVLKHSNQISSPPASGPPLASKRTAAQPAPAKPEQKPGGSITPLAKDWLPPGVSPVK
jgi:hypothetical protein